MYTNIYIYIMLWNITQKKAYNSGKVSGFKML